MMTMDEYMSKEDYCEINCGKENREGYKECINCGMLNVPTADVQPMKHGKWKKRMSTSDSIKCSVCGNNHEYETNYCPHCGARMDGDT